MNPEPLTYTQLLNNQSRLVTLGKLNPRTAANRATALRLFLRINHLHEEDNVGAEMRADYPAAVSRLQMALKDQGRSDRSITNTRSALTPWKQNIIEDDSCRAIASDKPTPFRQVLESVMKGVPTKRVARQVGVPPAMLYGWLEGKMPRASNSKYLSRIENMFALERGSLVSLAGTSRGERGGVGGGADEVMYRTTLGPRTRNEYYLEPPQDSPLRAQWAKLLRYKTAPVPPVLLRSAASRWTIASLAVIQPNENNWWCFIDGNEVPTAKSGWAMAASYLGWMALPQELGGLGTPWAELQTLAWFAVPDHIEAYLDWLKKRCGGRRTSIASVFLGMVAWMVRPGDGYISQQPELIETLPARLREVKWGDLCAGQHRYCARLGHAYKTEIEQTRDPFEPIRSIIELPEPMEAIADMVQRMRRDRPSGCAVDQAIWARDIVLIKLLVSNPLRRRNIAGLTWTRDNKGGLYQKTDQSWWIRIPKLHLKNRGGAVTDRGYDSPVHSSVWRDLERYLVVHRPTLVRWSTDLVFLTKTTDPALTERPNKRGPYKRPRKVAHAPFMEISKHVFSLTRKYLWKSPGIGTHAFRHIVATSILKTEKGDMKTAALVLLDRQSTVERHYSGLRSADGSVRMGELLAKSLNRM